MVCGHGVGVFEVEVVVALLDLRDRHPPGLLGFGAALAAGAAPPGHAIGKMLLLDRAGHRIGLLALGHAVLVVPDLLGGGSLLKKQQIGADAGVGAENGIGQPHDRVQVAFGQQALLQPRFDALAEQAAIGQHNRGPAAGLEQANEQGQEQISGFAGAELGRKIILNAVFLHTPKGRIGKDQIHLIGRAVAGVGPGQAVVVQHEAGILDPMQEHVGNAEHVGQLLLLGGPQPRLHRLFSGDGCYVVLAHVANGAGEEATRAHGGVEQQLTGFGVQPLHHEAGHPARRVVLTCIAGALQVVEQLLVDIAKVLPLAEIIEINAVDLIHHLPQQLARFHVVIGIAKHLLHHLGSVGIGALERHLLEIEKQLLVDELQQAISRDPLFIGSPAAPLQMLRDGRAVVVFCEFEGLVLVVDDLEEEQPAQLRKALGITINAHVLAHDVLNRLDRGAGRHLKPPLHRGRSAGRAPPARNQPSNRRDAAAPVGCPWH